MTPASDASNLKISGRISPIFRRRRMRRFLGTFNVRAETRILDVGGLPRFWEGIPIQSRITILNTAPLDDFESSFLMPNQEFVLGDGTRIDCDDEEFDILFSNSVIEHLGTFATQQAFAREARRAGKGYWVQTPARECLIEPHYFTLFVHWMPKDTQRKLLKNFSLWGLLGRPKPEIIELVLAELRLLSRGEFESLFSDGEIWTERLFGWPKSYTAYRLPYDARTREPQAERATVNAGN